MYDTYMYSYMWNVHILNVNTCVSIPSLELNRTTGLIFDTPQFILIERIVRINVSRFIHRIMYIKMNEKKTSERSISF